MKMHQRGNVVVRAITTAVDHSDVKVWEMRLHTEYPDVTVYEGHDKKSDTLSYVGVLLGAKATSRHADARYKGPTDLRFEVPAGERWKLFASCKGIRVQVAVYRGGIL